MFRDFAYEWDCLLGWATNLGKIFSKSSDLGQPRFMQQLLNSVAQNPSSKLNAMADAAFNRRMSPPEDQIWHVSSNVEL